MDDFQALKVELINIIGFANPVVEHIGSTSVNGLSAKPIIDVMVGLNSEGELNEIVQPLIDKEYIYYEKYNKETPYRRFFVRLKTGRQHFSFPRIIGEGDDVPQSLNDQSLRLAHIACIGTWFAALDSACRFSRLFKSPSGCEKNISGS